MVCHWKIQPKRVRNQYSGCSAPTDRWPPGLLLLPEGFMKTCLWTGFKSTVFLSFLFDNLLFCSLSKIPSSNKYLWRTCVGSSPAWGTSSFPVFALWMRSWISYLQMKESRLTDHQVLSIQQQENSEKKKKTQYGQWALFFFLPWKWIRSPFILTYLEGPEWKDTSFPNSEARNDLFLLLTECLLAFANQSRNCLMDLALSLSLLREREGWGGEERNHKHIKFGSCLLMVSWV